MYCLYGFALIYHLYDLLEMELEYFPFVQSPDQCCPRVFASLELSLDRGGCKLDIWKEKRHY